MNPLNPEPYQLAKRRGDGRYPYLGDDGVFLPDGTPLLRRTRYGDWEPRPLEALVKALAPHDDDIEVMAWRCRRLAAIADYLNKGDKVLAIISLLHLHLRGNSAVERGGLAKTSDAWTWEARIAAGLEGAGEWVAGAAAGVIGAASRLVLGPAGALLSILSGDTAENTVPGHPDLNYHYDQTRLSVWRTDAQGNQTLLYSGWPDADGSYRLDGTVIGHTDGSTSAALDGDALKSAPPVEGHLPVSVTGTSTGNPCPPPLPDIRGGMSPRAAAYQSQVTGLPPGLAVYLPDSNPGPRDSKVVSYDGCRTTDGTMLEAKGPGLAWPIDDAGNWKPYYKGRGEMEEQMDRQARVAAENGRNVEYHVAEEPLANYLRGYATRNGLWNVSVIHELARVP